MWVDMGRVDGERKFKVGRISKSLEDNQTGMFVGK